MNDTYLVINKYNNNQGKMCVLILDVESMSDKLIKKSYNIIFAGIILCLFLSSCKKQNDIDKYLSEPDVKTQNVIVNTNKNTDPAKDDTIIITLDNFGRENPFMPYRERNLTDDPYGSYDVPMPPSALGSDPMVDELMQAKIAGILYDGAKSSAIVNVSGSDYFVHKGDSVFDFYILDISKDKVTIKNGYNTYSAGVGEIIEGSINESNIYDVKNKFAGSKLRNTSKLPSIQHLSEIKNNTLLLEIEGR
jgi:Tfp pilus assembly protein PilP